ncbi:MAG: bifunctional riboflavin kinase/FAD synthetase, partial [Bacteroidetes bacterium]
NAVITTGSFDGVHVGHQKIFSRIKDLTEFYHGESVVITFDPHPRQVIYPNDDTLRLLTSTDEKIKYFRKFGINNVVVLPFTIEFSQQQAREYVEKFLIEKFRPKCLVVGYDHRFGLNREGNYDLLKQYADRKEFDLVKIDKQEIRDITVSSTKIRNALLHGEMEIATVLLAHPYNICGTVVHGQKLGQKLGYPTANILLDNPIKLLPPEGIYAVHAHVNGAQHGGMLYIGKRPTVTPVQKSLSIEVHLFDFEDDIYDCPIELDLLSFVREDQEMTDLEELQKAIANDEKHVRQVLEDYRPTESSEKVAIVALNYNGANVLPIYLPSFEKYGGQADIYIADNGSTDESIAIVNSQFSSMRMIELPENYGYAGGYNKALENLDYKYLALINTDIELTEGWLEPLIDVLESNPDIAAVQPKIRAAKKRDTFEYAGGCGGYMDRLGYPFCAGRILDDLEVDSGQYDRSASIFWASGAAFVIRSDVFYALGGFDGDYFAHMEEIDLCWRIHRAGFDIVYVPESIVYHEGGATLPYKSARKIFLNFRNNLATLIKNLPFYKLALVIPIRIALDALAGVHFIVKGQFGNSWAIVRAYFALFSWLPSLMRKKKIERQQIADISIGPETKSGWYQGSILWQYYIGGKKTFSTLQSRWHEGA